MKWSVLYLLLAFVDLQGQDSPEARAILEKTARSNQSGRSYRAEFSGKIEDKGSGPDRKSEFSGVVLAQSPGKLRAEVKTGSIEQWTIRNDAQTWMYLPNSKKYRTFPSTTASVVNLGSMDPSSLFGVVTAGVQSVEIAPDEIVTLEGSPARCYVITVNYETNPAQPDIHRRVTLWVDQMNFIVLRRKATVPLSVSEYPGRWERTLDLALTKLALAPTFTGSEFAFTPPEGATQMENPRAPVAGAPPAPTVSEVRLVKRVAPIYPQLARERHIQGTVRFMGVISKDGTVKNLELISGPPLLVNAAREAVKHWVYKPILINGQPEEVRNEIAVDFSISEK